MESTIYSKVSVLTLVLVRDVLRDHLICYVPRN
jgi:hypothetical protein